jgi:methylglutaconyl-CoA hydratase
MADAPATLLVVEQGVATITLNQPKSKNSLGAALTNSLCDNLKACVDNEEVRVIVLTNAGNTFCAGANLKGGQSEEPRYTIVDLFKMMQECPKVIVGRIAGHCTGGGCGVAAACDISVMSSEAQLGFTEVRIGVSPAIISVVCLPKMRRADAAELFLSGEKISAERAQQVGLVNHCVAPDALDAKVREITDKLVRGGPTAMSATKSLVYKVPGMTNLEEAFQWTAALSAKCFASPEAAQGILAFNKRVDAPWVPKAKL